MTEKKPQPRVDPVDYGITPDEPDLFGRVEPWMDDALCAQVDPEPFFPNKGGSTRDAKKICARCDVREQCLAYALETDERFGIWGGLSERERRNIRRAGS
jgi:hypothetical protein